MGVVDTLKETIGLIQKVDNIELYQRMLALQSQVFELVEENRALQERLSTQDQLTFKKNSYWKADDGPFCSRCWDAEQKLVRLHEQKGYVPRCPGCGHTAADPETPPPSPVSISRRKPWIDR